MSPQPIEIVSEDDAWAVMMSIADTLRSIGIESSAPVSVEHGIVFGLALASQAPSWAKEMLSILFETLPDPRHTQVILSIITAFDPLPKNTKT